MLGRVWSPPVRIDDGTACATQSVRVVLASSGGGIAAWNDTSPVRVRARRFGGAGGGGWSSSVEDAGAGWGSNLRLALAPTGDAMLLSTDAGHVRARASVKGAAWTPRSDVSGPTAVDTAADMAMDKNGAAMAVWIETAPMYGQATWNAAAGWTTPAIDGTDYQQITVAAYPDGGFSLASLGSGAAYYSGEVAGTFQSGIVHYTNVHADGGAQGSLTLLVGPSRVPCVAWIVPDPTDFPGEFDYCC